MQVTMSRLLAYAAFVAFCCLSSIRDVLSEIIFKHPQYEASPIFVLFVYSAITQLVACLWLLTTAVAAKEDASWLRGATNEILLLNVFTLAAFLFYFLAIQSPIGSAVNAFVDYGSGPIFTAIVAAIVVREPLTIRFAVSSVLSIAGLLVLEFPRLDADGISPVSLTGIALALVRSLFGALYQGYFKVLLQKGAAKSAIILLRLVGTTVVLGGILFMRPDLFRSDLLLETALVGLIGFAAPLFLVLEVLQRVKLQNFAVLLFLFPVLTLVISWATGYAKIFQSDIAAAALLLIAIILYERWKPR